MTSVTTEPASLPDAPAKKLYKCSALQYTKFGLFMVFAWLLWGDFVNALLDGAIPSILPLKLNEMGASDVTNQVLFRTFAYATAFMLNPLISFRSDRHRGRWGRRIPFLFWSTPFVGLALVLIGMNEGVTNVLLGGADHVTILGHAFGRQTVGLVVLGALLIAYDFANIFVGSVYYYLFNDVVPEQFLSRFLSLFRIVGAGAGMLYNAYVFPHAMSHFRLIFIVAGVAYALGFMAMCLGVREGQYPPPAAYVGQRKGIVAAIRTYARECFTHRFYWYFFLSNTCRFLCGMTGTFMILRNTKSLGLSLSELGQMNVYIGLVSLLLQYPCGWASDRWNPIRVFTASSVLVIFGSMAACVWVFVDFGHHGNLVYMWVTSLVFLPIAAIGDAAEGPMYMKLLPKDRYGQFCSANAMIRAFALIFGSMVAAYFIQSLDTYGHMGIWRYRYVPVWALFFQIPAAVLILLLYREWKARGGQHGYTPPEVVHDAE